MTSPTKRMGKDIGYNQTCKVCDNASIEEFEFYLVEERNNQQ
ncbi:MAG: hypothetical protein ACFFDH_09885 [Promethearchaeota archaeon]